ncbi:MAG: Vitamin B12 dependent methionine synthase activation subunit [Ruminococcus sp.]|nr:Vitamin B12 dependent methionine synthase activation subunit [Ruminococcus sp.]
MMKKLIFDEPVINRKEILRYARVKDEIPDISALLNECIEEARGVLVYRVGYAVLPVQRTDNEMILDVIHTSSNTVSKAISHCDEAVIFAATIGTEYDRLILRYSRLSPSKALLLQALGAERVESLCDAFCQQMNTELRLEEKSLRTRVSPGYGDISLTMQKEIFAILDCERKLGITLNNDLMMTPTKSVTAIAGIRKN